MSPPGIGDGVELLVAIGMGGRITSLLEIGQRGIDHARAGRIEARRFFLDRLDQVIAVARLLIDQIERYQAEVTRCQHAAYTKLAPHIAPVSVAVDASSQTSPTTSRHGFHAPPIGFSIIPVGAHLLCSDISLMPSIADIMAERPGFKIYR